jgi:DinB family protein
MSVATLVGAPAASEFNPYYGRYISLVTGSDILSVLEKQMLQTRAVLSSISEERAAYRYAPEKWSIKQVVGHMTDTERVFAYRALRIARGDKTPLEGFEQDDYVRSGPFEHCPLADLADEYAAVRDATVRLFRALDQAAWMRTGVANQNEVSVRAIAYIIAGHELHHRRILEEKYLSQLAVS